MKNERDFVIAIKNCDTFKKFEKFKQGIILKRDNIIKLYDKYQQATVTASTTLNKIQTSYKAMLN